jgi:transposase
MTCATCARIAPPATTGRASAASLTRSTPSGSRAKRWRTRYCRGRSSAPARTPALTSRASCWRSGGAPAARCSLLRELPLGLIEQLPDSQQVRPRLAALARVTRRRRFDAPTALRLRVLGESRAEIAKLDAEARHLTRELARLVDASGSTLDQLCGLSTVSVAELLVEVGDPRRFTEGGFARFNGTAPLAASTAEGPGEPIRHRYNPAGNRRVNAVLYRMAITQLRLEPRAKAIYANARANNHTKKEARRILKRHLSDVVYRRMIRDLETQLTDQPLLAA